MKKIIALLCAASICLSYSFTINSAAENSYLINDFDFSDFESKYSVLKTNGTAQEDTEDILGNNTSKLKLTADSKGYQIERSLDDNADEGIYEVGFSFYSPSALALKMFLRNADSTANGDTSILSTLLDASGNVRFNHYKSTVKDISSDKYYKYQNGYMSKQYNNGKWSKLVYVMDLRDDSRVTDYDTSGQSRLRFDVYLYQTDNYCGEDTEWTLVAQKPQIQWGDADLENDCLKTVRFDFDAASEGVYIDDLYVKNLDVDFDDAVASLDIGSEIPEGGLELPTVLPDGSEITWSSSDDTALYIEDNTAKIGSIIGESGILNDVALIADITNSRVSSEVQVEIFEPVIKSTQKQFDFQLGPTEIIDTAKDAVKYYENTVINQIPKIITIDNSYSLPNAEEYDTSFVWSIEDNDYVKVDGDMLNVISKPAVGQDDYETELKLTVTSTYNGGNHTEDYTFKVVVPANAPETDEDKFNLDKASLLKGIDLTNVTGDLPLETECRYGSKVVWSSDNISVIKPNGTVIQPDYYVGGTWVKLSADISLGDYRETVAFDVYVCANNNKSDSIFNDTEFTKELIDKEYKLINTVEGAKVVTESVDEVGGNTTSKLMMSAITPDGNNLSVERDLENLDNAIYETSFSFYAENGWQGSAHIFSQSGKDLMYLNIKEDGSVSLNPSSTTNDPNHKYVALDSKYTVGKWNKFVLVANTIEDQLDYDIDETGKIRFDIYMYTADVYDGENTEWTLKAKKATVQSTAHAADDSLGKLQLNLDKGRSKTVYFDDIYAKNAATIIGRELSTLEVPSEITDTPAKLSAYTERGYSVIWTPSDSDSLVIEKDGDNITVKKGIVPQSGKFYLTASAQYVGDASANLKGAITTEGSVDFEYSLDKNFDIQSPQDAVYYYKRYVLMREETITLYEDTMELPHEVLNDTSVKWSLENNEYVSITGNTLNVLKRPGLLEADYETVLTADISSNYNTDTPYSERVVYKLKVAHTQPENDKEKFDADCAAILRGIDLSAVTDNLIMPTLGEYGSEIVWTTSNSKVISLNGTVIRPNYYLGDEHVTLTATVTFGSMEKTLNFEVTVLKKSQETSDDYIFNDKDFSKEIINSSYESVSVVEPVHRVEISNDAVDTNDTSKLKLEVTESCDSNLVFERDLGGVSEKVTEIGFSFYTSTGYDGSIFINNKSGQNILYYNVKPDGTISLNPYNTTETALHKYVKLDKKYGLSKWNKLVCVINAYNDRRDGSIDPNGKKKYRVDVFLYKTDWYRGENTEWSLVASKSTIQSNDPNLTEDVISKIQFSMSKSSAKSVYIDDIYMRDCDVTAAREVNSVDYPGELTAEGITLAENTAGGLALRWESDDRAALKVSEDCGIYRAGIGTVADSAKTVNLNAIAVYTGDKTAGLSSPIEAYATKSFEYILQPNLTVNSNDAAIEYFMNVELFEDDNVFIDSKTNILQLCDTEKYNTHVEWSLADNNYIELVGSKLVVNSRPSYIEGPAEISLVANVVSEYDGTKTSRQKEFKIILEHIQPTTTSEKVEADLASIFRGLAFDNITEDISMPYFGQYGSKIVYEISDRETIDYTGKVTRPSVESGDKIVTITVTASMVDSDTTNIKLSKTVKLTVLAFDSDIDKLKRDSENIKLPSRASSDFALPLSGDFAETIVWASSNTQYIKIQDGTAKVTKPTGSDRNVVLKAALKKGDSVYEASYTVTVVGSGQSTGGGGGGGGGSSSGGGAGSPSVVSPKPPVDVEPIEQPNTELTDNKIFDDMTGYEWAEPAVEYLYKTGIIEGVGDNRFEPWRGVTRAEFVKMIMQGFEFSYDRLEVAESFSDVKSDAWYYDDVLAAASLGIVNGYSDDVFAPDNGITREEMAVIAYRALGLKGIELQDYISEEFADMSDISDYAVESVELLHSNKLLNGDDNGNFNPKNEASRAETAQFLYNIIIKYYS